VNTSHAACDPKINEYKMKALWSCVCISMDTRY